MFEFIAKLKKQLQVWQLEINGHKKIKCDCCNEFKWVHKVMVKSFEMWGGFICWECKAKSFKVHNPGNGSPNFSEYGMDKEISYCHDSFVEQKLKERPVNLYCCRLTPELAMESYGHKLNIELQKSSQ